MSHRAPFALLAPLVLGLNLAGAEASESLRLRVLPLGDRGLVRDLTSKEWKVKVGGQAAEVLSQRGPAETGKDPQRWAFVLLPVRDPEMRQLVLQTLATFMTTLPPSDAVLVVLRTDKGMECLTPGFTTRPSLWAKALDCLYDELPSGLTGNPDPGFTLPQPPGPEAEEGMDPVQAVLARLAAQPVSQRRNQDLATPKAMVAMYPVETLGTYAKSVTRAIDAVAKVGEALARVPGETQLVVVSRSEIDDLAHPNWSRKAASLPAGNAVTPSQDYGYMAEKDIQNTKLQTEMMVRDVTLARTAFKATFGRLGLTLHSLGGAGAGGYDGAFGEAAVSTGGNNFRFDMQLPQRLPQILGTWASRYELSVAVPAGVPRPAPLAVASTRPGVRVTAPQAW